MSAIRQINSPDEFVRLCKMLLCAEFEDFQTVDDSGGDGGNDGYSETAETLFQFYCPRKPEKAVDRTYKAKILEDLKKAMSLVESGRYRAVRWIFVTPCELREPVQTFLRQEARNRGFQGIAWADPKLTELLSKHSHLQSQFPTLVLPDVDARLEAGIGQLHDSIDKLPQSVASMMTSLLSSQLLDQEHHAELDHAKELLAQLKPKQALGYLQKLHDRIFSRADGSVRFRLLTNLAVAKAEVGDTRGAGQLFVQAHQYSRDDEKAQCNRAMGHLLLGEVEQASALAKKVIYSNPACAQAYAVLIQCSSVGDSLEHALAAIPDAVRTSVEVARAIAQAALLRGDDESAAHWLEQALARSNDTSPDLQAELGAAILRKVADDVGVLASTQLSSDERRDIRRAVDLLSLAISAAREGDLLSCRPEWLANRSAGHRLSGDLSAALSDINEALALVPSGPVLIRNKAVLLNATGDARGAVELFRTIASSPAVPEAAVLLAEVLNGVGDPEGARIALEDTLNQGNADIVEEKKRFLLHLAIQAGEIERARELCYELSALDPQSVTTLVSAAEIERLAGNESARAARLHAAIENCSSATPLRDRVHLAQCLFRDRDFGTAARVYESFVDIRVESILANQLLIAYYETGQVERALAMCEERHSSGDRLAAQIDFSLRSQIGDLEGAVSVARTYLAIHPGDQDVRVRLAAALLRADRLAELDELLDIPFSASELTVDLGFHLVAILAERGRSLQAIDMAYELRREHFDQGDVHMKYVGTMFGRDRSVSVSFESDALTAGFAAQLVDEDGRLAWHVLEDRKDATAARHEVNVESALGRRLRGVRRGERAGDTNLTVVDIKSKYVYALHESLELLPLHFADVRGVERVKVRTSGTDEEIREGLQPMLERVAHRTELVDVYEDLYLQAKIPLGAFSECIGRNAVEVWDALVSSGRGARCCVGTETERAEAHSTLLQHRRCVADLSSLLTALRLGVLGEIRKIFDEMLVSQSSLDLLSQAISRLRRTGSEGYASLHIQDGVLRREHFSAEQVEREAARLSELKSWIRENCQVVAVKGVVSFRSRRGRDLKEVLGVSFFESVLAAHEGQCSLYSDDLVTRVLAQQELGVPGVWTQAAILHGVETKLLPLSVATRVAASLIDANLAHTTVDDLVLAEAASQSGWKNVSVFSKLLGALSAPKAELESVLAVVANFAARLWQEPLLETQRQSLFVAILEAIKLHRTPGSIGQILEPLILRRLRLSPIVAGRIVETLRAWHASQVS